MFPQLGTDWATWSLLAAELIIIPVFLFYKPSFKRSLIDFAENHDDSPINTNYTTPLLI